MICVVLAGIIASQPLMIAGNEVGIWFVRDTIPGSLGPEHELCQLLGEDKYQVVLPLAARPLALGVNEQTLWFVGDGDKPVLYCARLVENQATGDLRTVPRGRATALITLELEGAIRSMIFLDDKPILVVENDGLQCFDTDGLAMMPNLRGNGGQMAVISGSIIAAIPSTNQEVRGVQIWHQRDKGWIRGPFVSIEGKLCDLVIKDDWPLLVSSNGSEIIVSGLQNNQALELASFPTLAGRWAIVSKPSSGLVAIGAERNGTTTKIDLGWPSCKASDPIVLSEQYGSNNPVEMVIMIGTTIVFFILISIFLRSRPKNNNKMDSSTPSSGR
ncbi:MAG: hypothetical protein QF444_02785 [Phycisphaerales bacterium]|jgi:hypothetical protein|nr:hypothetical protein [Phycisphaerales bacterium]